MCGRNSRKKLEKTKMNASDNSYKWIFKSTTLFGFVQLFRILVGVVKNKFVAIFLGSEGMGLLGIYSTSISFLQQGAGLGLSQSGVRDIAEANAKADISKFSHVINVINRLILFTGLLGCIVTLILSKFLSQWTLGNSVHTIAYAILSVVVAFNIMNEGKQAILKGMRQLKALANASMIGVGVGFVTALPLYYFFGQDGIVPELLISSISAFWVSRYFVRKISYQREQISFKTALFSSQQLLFAGGALMLTAFFASGANLIILSYIRSVGGLNDVGLYSAGSAIMTTYFGVVINALSTDYFPRISAVNHNNKCIEDELNKQSIVSMLLCGPLFVLFIVLLPLFVKILYTEEFLPAVDFVKYGVIGTMITIVSNQVDMILVAKFRVKIFFTVSVIYRCLQIVINILLYRYWGLIGTGISLAVMGCLHLLIMVVIVYKLYNIKFNSLFLRLATVIIAFIVVSLIINELPASLFKYIAGIITVIVSLFFSYAVTKYKLGLDILKYLKNKIYK